MDGFSTELNRSSVEERAINVKYMRWLYILLAVELLVAVAWSTVALHFWHNIGEPIARWWEFGVVAASLVALLIFAALFLDFTRKLPINWLIYLLFTLAFAHLAAFLNCVEPKGVLYFGLWELTAIALAFALYGLCKKSYMSVIEVFLIVFVSAVGPLIGFIYLTNVNLFYLILVYAATGVFGVYLAANLRATVRDSIFEPQQEDPVNGAVKVWIESALVFCRVGELLGNAAYR